MKLKVTEIDGKTYAEVQDGHPVYVHTDGKEIPFDAAQAMGKIKDLGSEAKTHREAKEAAEGKLKAFDGLDPAKAKDAIEKLGLIDQKKLIEAGDRDAAIEAALKPIKDELEAEKAKNGDLSNTLNSEMIGGRFSRSKFLQDKVAIPADLVQASFGKHFKIEDGKVVAHDAAGNKIFSRTKHGEPADFDEAIEMLVEAYPHKDSILKGTGNTGSGANPGGGGGGQGGGKTISRDQFSKLAPADQMAKVKEGFSVTDAA
jgi:hypothetical protein